MRGIPYSTIAEDIVKFFDGCDLVEGSVKIGKMHDGKLTGEACALFPSNELAKKAHLALNQQYLGKRWVELFVISDSEHANFLEN